MSERFKFGDIIENGWASEENPRKRGVYLWSFTRTGRMNPGKHVKLRYEDGKTGELPISDDGKVTVVGTIFDAALSAKYAEIDRLRGVIEWCLSRDERNGSLPQAYVDKLAGALNGGS